jgi:hypothetical protein
MPLLPQIHRSEVVHLSLRVLSRGQEAAISGYRTDRHVGDRDGDACGGKGVQPTQLYGVEWKNIDDWIEAQMALLETEMAQLDCPAAMTAVERRRRRMLTDRSFPPHMSAAPRCVGSAGKHVPDEGDASLEHAVGSMR